jgi:hypothetical protein
MPPPPSPLQVRTSKTFMRDVTVVSPMALLLFGNNLKILYAQGCVVVDEWIRIKAPAQTAGGHAPTIKAVVRRCMSTCACFCER